jgi:hypothetical protein
MWNAAIQILAYPEKPIKPGRYLKPEPPQLLLAAISAMTTPRWLRYSFQRGKVAYGVGGSNQEAC